MARTEYRSPRRWRDFEWIVSGISAGGSGDEPIQALPPYSADEPLTSRIGLRTTWRRLQHIDTEILDGLVQLVGEDAIAVVKLVRVAVVRSNGFAHCCSVQAAVVCAVTLQ